MVLCAGLSRALGRIEDPDEGAAFKRAVEALGLDVLQPSLYSNRHGGASEDYLRRRRTLQEIQFRGRWRSEASIRGYTKSAKLLSEMRKARKHVLKYGAHIELNLEASFRHPAAMPSPDDQRFS